MQKKTTLILVLALVCGFMFTFTSGPAQARTRFVSIGTGGTGGVYYPYGGGVAEIWSKKVDGIKAVAEVTGASVENTKLCSRGETLFGEIMSDVASQAYTGTGKIKDKPQKILGMIVMSPNVYHVVTRADSGINSLADLKGKKVSVGAPGSGTEFMTNLILEGALGIPYSSFKVFRLSFNENANALKDNSIDVGIWCVAPPTSSIMDLATTHKIKIIPFTKAEINKVTSKYPFYSGYTLPAGVYKGQDQEVYTASVWNTFICNADLDEELVYKLTKAVFENQKYLIKIHHFAKYTTPENAIKYSAIPLHPGAAKYIREQGIDIPERLIAK
jgi:TRAP transporter TAXI family solute receptor